MKMNGRLLIPCSLSLLTLLAAPLSAQEPTPTTSSVTPTATPSAGSANVEGVGATDSKEILTWKIYAGLQTQLRPPRASDFTYRAQYKDKPIGKQGKDLSFLSVTGEFGKPGAAEEVDSSDLLINFERGEGVSESGLLDFLNVKEGFPFKFKPLKAYPLRTATQAGANFKTKTYSVAFGFETPSFKLSQVGIGDGTTLSNWLTLGLAANQKWRPAAAGGDKFTGIATYRCFIGKAWGFRQVPEDKFYFTLEQILDPETGIAPTFDKLKAGDETDPPADPLSKLDTFLSAVWNSQDFMDAEGDSNHPLRNTSNYRARVTTQFNRYLASTYERDPSLSIHFEAAGWYNLARVQNEKRLNSGAALVLTKWFSAGKTAPRSSIQARLDYGRAFSNSTHPQRTASLILGLNF